MQRILLHEQGIVPGTDCTQALYALCAAHSQDTTFVFAPGDYYFDSRLSHDYRLSNTEPLPTRQLAIWLRHAKNVHLEGNGARLWFSGQVQPITLDHCENCSVSGFTIDWKKPMVAEGIVRGYTDKTVDLYIDPVAFPHRYAEGWLEFDTGNGEWYPLLHTSMIQYDLSSCTVRQNTGDRFVPTEPILPLGGSVYRFTSKYAANLVDTALGNCFVLRHNERLHAGIFAEKCASLRIADITVHSCGGLGCLVQFCKDVSFQRVQFVPNISAGRMITSGRDDGMQIACCSGHVSVDSCTFLGLMDDPINVHGCCVVVQKCLDSRTLLCRYMHPQAKGFAYWAETGDRLSFLRRDTLETCACAVVASYSLCNDTEFLLRFAEDLPVCVQQAAPDEMAVDNTTHNVSFTCTRNRFGSCRARGLLVSTAGPVRIAENTFESSGSAVLVAGDANYWFESGPCRDVEITRNVFTKSCLSSMYQFTEGVISVCPVVPSPTLTQPFHRQIRISDNVFDCPDIPLLYAFSTDTVLFEGNRVCRAHMGRPWHSGKHLLRFSYCNNVSIADNSLIGSFTLAGLQAEHCGSVSCTDWPQ